MTAGDIINAATSMETVLYPVANQPLINLILPLSSILSAFGAYYLESTGKNTGYSKFAKDTGKQQVPARLGMLILYSPAFLLALYSFLTLGNVVDGRVTLVTSLLTVHFGKRVAEVLFLHKFSGKQDLSTSVGIGSLYAFNTFCLLWVQNNVCSNSAPPTLDLSTLGVIVFAVGILGNLYHHWILAGLRKDENGGYQVPEGGLFGLVTCPHYFFEIVDFVGMALASQTFFAIGWAAFTAGYLSGRSVSTRNWYLKKVDNFPEGRKNIVPFLF